MAKSKIPQEIFDEKTLVSITKIFSSIGENYKIDEAYLFGSYAKGTQTETSDIDLAIVSDAISSLDKLFVSGISRGIDPRIHLKVYNTQEFENENDITAAIKSGIPIFTGRKTNVKNSPSRGEGVPRESGRGS